MGATFRSHFLLIFFRRFFKPSMPGFFLLASLFFERRSLGALALAMRSHFTAIALVAALIRIRFPPHATMMSSSCSSSLMNPIPPSFPPRLNLN